MDRTERARMRIESNPDPNERTARVVERNKVGLRRRLKSLDPADPDRAYLLFILSDALMAEQQVVVEEAPLRGQAAVLADHKRIKDEVIDVLREATEVAAPDDPDRHYYHGNLGAMLAQRWGMGDAPFDLVREARRHIRTALDLVPEDHPLYCSWATQLASNLALGEGQPSDESLAEAIELHTHALRLAHPDDLFRGRYIMAASGTMAQLALMTRDRELATRARDKAVEALKNTHEYDPFTTMMYATFKEIINVHGTVHHG